MVARFYSRCWVLDKGGSEISTEKEFEVCSPACVFTQQLGVLQQLRLCTKSPGLGSCRFATFEHVTLFHVAIFSEFQFPYFSNGAYGKLTSQRFFFSDQVRQIKTLFKLKRTIQIPVLVIICNFLLTVISEMSALIMEQVNKNLVNYQKLYSVHILFQ